MEVNAKAGHTLPSRWLQLKYIPTLNPIEKKAFEEAIHALVNDGIVEYIEGSSSTIKLTVKGEEGIYQ